MSPLLWQPKKAGFLFMREQLRHELLSAIGEKLSAQDLQIVSRRIDEALSRYSIELLETHLAVLGREEMERLIKTYIVVKRMEGLSNATLENYTRVLWQFMRAMRKPVGEIEANDIRLYLYEYQEQRGVSNRSLDSIRVVICTFFKWAACEQYIPRSPVETIRPIKYEAKPRRAATQIELELLRRGCRDERELAILETLYSTGCRVSELIGIKLGDINWETRTVLLLGKGKKYRQSYINAKAEVAIREYLKVRKHDSIYLLCNDRGGMPMTKGNVERVMRGIAERAGMGGMGISPHVMRHTTATQALRSGMAVEDIQRLLGHASVSTTMVYAKVSQDNVRDKHQKYIV